ncbi:hypothetical protein [Actinomadura rifamycini]|uniref:hypothetical protein n=1 Tax=Actinomadura rifamycini TaxID=31962 RepID=UPI0003F4F2AF|nr:hypothetical protein [Actinomadura rifamycini]
MRRAARPLGAPTAGQYLRIEGYAVVPAVVLTGASAVTGAGLVLMSGIFLGAAAVPVLIVPPVPALRRGARTRETVG